MNRGAIKSRTKMRQKWKHDIEYRIKVSQTMSESMKRRWAKSRAAVRRVRSRVIDLHWQGMTPNMIAKELSTNANRFGAGAVSGLLEELGIKPHQYRIPIEASEDNARSLAQALVSFLKNRAGTDDVLLAALLTSEWAGAR